VKEYLATLNNAAYGAASEAQPKFVSPSDPAAQWTGALKGPAFLAYADNYLIDVQEGVIIDVEASRAIRPGRDGSRTDDDRADRVSVRLQATPAHSASGCSGCVKYLVGQKRDCAYAVSI
jgi:hypothetical protein